MLPTKRILVIGVGLFIFGSIGSLAILKSTIEGFNASNLMEIYALILIASLIGKLLIWRSFESNVVHMMISSLLLLIDVSMTLIAIGLPIFFIFPLDTSLGKTIGILLLLFHIVNMAHTNKEFSKKWGLYGEGALQSCSTDRGFDLPKYRDQLKLDVDILLFLPPHIGAAIKIALLASMLIGGAFITKEQPFTILFLTLPPLLILAVFSQMIVIFFRQIITIRRAAKAGKITLKLRSE